MSQGGWLCQDIREHIQFFSVKVEGSCKINTSGSFSDGDDIVGEESAAGLGYGAHDAFEERIPSGHGVTDDGSHDKDHGVGDDGGRDEGHGVGDDGGQLANMFCWNLPLGHHHHLSAPLKQSNATRVSSLIEQYGNKELCNIVHFCLSF